METVEITLGEDGSDYTSVGNDGIGNDSGDGRMARKNNNQPVGQTTRECTTSEQTNDE